MKEIVVRITEDDTSYVIWVNGLDTYKYDKHDKKVWRNMASDMHRQGLFPYFLETLQKRGIFHD